MKKIVIGLDISQNNLGVGIVAYNDDSTFLLREAKNFDMRTIKWLDALGKKVNLQLIKGLELTDYLEKYLSMYSWKEVNLGIEFSNLLKGSNVPFYCGLWTGFIAKHFFKYNLNLKFINPASWKSLANLKGDTKEQKKHSIALVKSMGIDVNNDNASDAYLLALFFDKVNDAYEFTHTNKLEKEIRSMYKNYKKIDWVLKLVENDS